MAVILKANVPPVKVFRFGPTTDGSASMKNELGGKGANLAEMANLGAPVPPGFTIPCEVSVKFKEYRKKAAHMSSYMGALWNQVSQGIDYLDNVQGHLPLVSVRSGARVSMPGMMDTILNVGLTSDTIDFWAAKLGARTAYDSYRRLIQMYSTVALGVPMAGFEKILSDAREAQGVSTDAEISAGAMKTVVGAYFLYLEKLGVEFPDTFEEQWKGAILSVFRSWDNPRAIEYRKIHGYPESWGTAVNIQTMVFGNSGNDSATGVLFTRDPASGTDEIVGEYLVNAQGEDVVAGIRTPLPLGKMADWNNGALEELVEMVSKFEAHYRDMQDVEFTIDHGKLYALQTRTGKRSAKAAFKIAYDMAMAEIITKDEAVSRVTQKQLLAVTQASIDPSFKDEPSLMGIAAGGGLVSGKAVFTAADAVSCTEPCILIRKETDPDDIAGINAAIGVLTATGGLTSHAAVVARGMNKSCVVGATDLVVFSDRATFGKRAIKTGTKVTIDGATGRVWTGIDVPVITGASDKAVKAIAGWAMENGGFSERINLSSLMTQEEMTEALAECHGSIYLDTALLEDPRGIDPFVICDAMSRVKNALLTSPATEILIDLASMQDSIEPPDRMVNLMFGKSILSPAEVVSHKTSELLGWGTELLSKMLVKLPQGATDEYKWLAAKGVRCLGHITTVAELLAATGPVQASEDVISSVFGGEDAYRAIIKMVEDSTGKKLSGELPSSVYWYESLITGGV